MSTCSICHEDVLVQLPNIYTPPCEHTHHASCLVEWASSNRSGIRSVPCPICRENILTGGGTAVARGELEPQFVCWKEDGGIETCPEFTITLKGLRNLTNEDGDVTYKGADRAVVRIGDRAWAFPVIRHSRDDAVSFYSWEHRVYECINRYSQLSGAGADTRLFTDHIGRGAKRGGERKSQRYGDMRQIIRNFLENGAPIEQVCVLDSIPVVMGWEG